MRLIGSIAVLDGHAVQSFGYGNYLPVGDPHIIAEAMSEWGVSEIFFQCFSTGGSVDIQTHLLSRLRNSKLNVPVTYSGGIRCVSDAVTTLTSGADRVGIDTLIRQQRYSTVVEIEKVIGAQALTAILPVYSTDKRPIHAFTRKPLDFYKKYLELCSEVVVIDVNAEAKKTYFKEDTVSELLQIGVNENRIIVCGNIINTNEKDLFFLKKLRLGGICIENTMPYREDGARYTLKKLEYLNFDRKFKI